MAVLNDKAFSKLLEYENVEAALGSIDFESDLDIARQRISDAADEPNNESQRNRRETVQTQPTQQFTSTRAGPKGVLDDYREYSERQRLAALAKKDELYRTAQKHQIRAETEAEEALRLQLESTVESEYDIDTDEVAYAHYREQRMREMQMQMKSRTTPLKLSPGKLIALNATNYIDNIIENPPKNIVCFVLIFSPLEAASKWVCSCFEYIAQAHKDKIFCKIHNKETDNAFPSSSLPVLLVYQNEHIGTILNVHSKCNPCNAHGIEKLLWENGFIDEVLLGEDV